MSVAAVVPTYNRSDLLGETLDSIIRRTRPPDEIIVVNDGSTDNTASLVSRYAAPVRCITIENSGDIVARNVGLRETTSEMVAFCDSDDLWQPNYLHELAVFWRAVPHIHSVYSNFSRSMMASGQRVRNSMPRYRSSGRRPSSSRTAIASSRRPWSKSCCHSGHFSPPA